MRMTLAAVFSRSERGLADRERSGARARRTAGEAGALRVISFDNGGEWLISPAAHEDSMKKMGIITDRGVNGGGSP